MTQTHDETKEQDNAHTEASSEDASQVEETPQPISDDEQYQQLYDQFVRLQADFDNYRKRAEAEKQQWIHFGVEKTLRELLPVLDNLERATASLSESSEPKMLYQSFRLVYDGLLNGLGNAGLQSMDAVGKPFNPVFHEAVGQIDSEHPEDMVATELQKGFLLGEKVIRPAMVQVSTGNGAAPVADEPTAEPKTQNNPFKQVN